jgi:hypothetical protein
MADYCKRFWNLLGTYHEGRLRFVTGALIAAAVVYLFVLVRDDPRTYLSEAQIHEADVFGDGMVQQLGPRPAHGDAVGQVEYQLTATCMIIFKWPLEPCRAKARDEMELMRQSHARGTGL